MSKTVIAGIGSILMGVGTILSAFANGDVSTIDWTVSLGAISAGLGLIFGQGKGKSEDTPAETTKK